MCVPLSFIPALNCCLSWMLTFISFPHTNMMVLCTCIRVQAMTSIKNLDSTAIYAYTTLISMCICVPLALIFEGAYRVPPYLSCTSTPSGIIITSTQ